MSFDLYTGHINLGKDAHNLYNVVRRRGGPEVIKQMSMLQYYRKKT